ncbi:hypothetical protein SAMD00079811_55970 [Scytonema sp. HK-05]|uniref:hypothetical protein n=1 Tax=Scytonema sp. HK-05 TaxID=1137095 RepID=UPI00093657C0|nr:hypothetical protein [Scytonema sp. HK-05]OKH42141.1 hypothetical protein NIES2130_39770 [Scytonema sp. HK-05]BAY47978.1 hypothetical protein SAMD00079811_55970 [Scytonema sp. HK-05]
MSSQKKQPNGCGCLNIPISLILVIFGGGYWWFSQKSNLDISKFLAKIQQINIPFLNPIPTPTSTVNPNIYLTPTPSLSSPSNLTPNNKQPFPKTRTPQTTALPQTPWEKKVIRGIYLSRYQVTNNADEKTIRERVRYYRSQGIIAVLT